MKKERKLKKWVRYTLYILLLITLSTILYFWWLGVQKAYDRVDEYEKSKPTYYELEQYNKQ